MARFHVGSIVVVAVSEHIRVRGQIARLVRPTSARADMQYIVIDEEGRYHQCGVESLYGFGEVLPDGSVPLESTRDVEAVREATNHLLALPIVEAEIELISIYRVPEKDLPQPEGPHKKDLKAYVWSWDIPQRMVQAGMWAKSGMELAPEMVFFLTCSVARRDRYLRTLQLLERKSRRQYDVYIYHVLGKISQVELARRWGISQPAIAKYRKKAMEFVNQWMGWSIEGMPLDEMAHKDPNWGVREALGHAVPSHLVG